MYVMLQAKIISIQANLANPTSKTLSVSHKEKFCPTANLDWYTLEETKESDMFVVH